MSETTHIPQHLERALASLAKAWPVLAQHADHLDGEFNNALDTVRSYLTSAPLAPRTDAITPQKPSWWLHLNRAGDVVRARRTPITKSMGVLPWDSILRLYEHPAPSMRVLDRWAIVGTNNAVLHWGFMTKEIAASWVPLSDMDFRENAPHRVCRVALLDDVHNDSEKLHTSPQRVQETPNSIHDAANPSSEVATRECDYWKPIADGGIARPCNCGQNCDALVQRNIRGEPVLPNRLRDMVHTMAEIELRRREHPSPYYPAFSAEGCAASGEWDYDDAESIFAELLALGYVETDPEFGAGAYRTTPAGLTWLDEQLALVHIPPFNSPEYRAACKEMPHG